MILMWRQITTQREAASLSRQSHLPIYRQVKSFLTCYRQVKSNLPCYRQVKTSLRSAVFNGMGKNYSSLSVGHYELCRDDIGDLPGSPEHL